MSVEADKAYTFRSYVPNDVNFIQSSWGISYFEGTPGHKQLSPEEFHKYHRPIRERALANPNVAAIICQAKNDPDHIIGWILVEKPPETPFMLCHYIYVKSTFHGEGIARELVKIALPIRPVLFTHQTQKSKRIMKENWKAKKNEFDRWFNVPHIV